MYPIIFNILGRVSIGTIYRWHKQIKTKDDYTILIPNYDYGEKECNVNLTKEEEICFKSLLLSPNKINIGKATKLTKCILNKKDSKHHQAKEVFADMQNCINKSTMTNGYLQEKDKKH